MVYITFDIFMLSFIVSTTDAMKGL